MNALKCQNESHVVFWMNEIQDKIQDVAKNVEERIKKSSKEEEIDRLVSLHIFVE